MLSDIIAGITARLRANGFTGTTALSKRAVPGNLPPPRIVFVPRGTEASARSTTPAGAPGQPLGTNANVSYIVTRVITVDAHVYAADPTRKDDYGAAEQLLKLLIQAVHAETVGSYEYLGEPGPEGDASQTAVGEVIVARFRFKTPVPRVPGLLVPPPQPRLNGITLGGAPWVTSGGPWNFVVSRSLSLAGTNIDLSQVTDAPGLAAAIQTQIGLGNLESFGPVGLLGDAVSVVGATPLTIGGDAATLALLGLPAATITAAELAAPMFLNASAVVPGAFDLYSFPVSLAGVTNAAELAAAMNAVIPTSATVVGSQVQVGGGLALTGDLPTLQSLGLPVACVPLQNSPWWGGTGVVFLTSSGPWDLRNDSFTLDGLPVALTASMDAAALKSAIDALGIDGLTATVDGAAVQLQTLTPVAVGGLVKTLNTLGIAAGTLTP